MNDKRDNHKENRERDYRTVCHKRILPYLALISCSVKARFVSKLDEIKEKKEDSIYWHKWMIACECVVLCDGSHYYWWKTRWVALLLMEDSMGLATIDGRLDGSRYYFGRIWSEVIFMIKTPCITINITIIFIFIIIIVITFIINKSPGANLPYDAAGFSKT